MNDTLFIGVDGGGTRSRARLTDGTGRLLGEGVGGSANIRLDPELVWNSVLTACRGAVDAAGLAEADLARAHAGLGLAGSSQRAAAERILSYRHPFAAVALATDAHVAWLGAFGGKDGAILIVGTGSCGYAVVDGKSHYVGGWGFEISDEGSGAALGRELLRRAIWAHDGRRPVTALADTILRRFGSPEAIADFAEAAQPSDFAGFAPTILDHGRAGDALAIELVTEAVAAVAAMADRLLGLGAPALCLVGGLAGPLRLWLPAHVVQALSPPQSDAMEGAIILARGAARG
jgi:glucosamine kinase